MFSIFPYYSKYKDKYTISPEMWNDNDWIWRGKSDGIVALTNLDRDEPEYGFPLIKVMYECKNKAVISFKNLCKDQLWDQAHANKNDDGRLCVISQIGLEVCVFRFYLTDKDDKDREECWTHFTPLNLQDLDREDLDFLGIKYVYETINNKDIIWAIYWRLDNEDELRYIHDMLDFISKNEP